MRSKYTFIYNTEIEKTLDSVLADIAKESRADSSFRHLKYLVLGGGYGRGEGGILIKENGEAALYNDLDFFVISNTRLFWKNTRLDQFFKKASEKWEKKLGINVDFSGAKSAKYIRSRSHIMVWREMILASTLLIGDEEEFKRFFTPISTVMPPSETAKLLVNRMSGLFLAKQRLLRRSELFFEDYDFIARNINKAVLACGDALLLFRGKYALKVQERLQNLEAIHIEKTERWAKLKTAYAEAVQFKKTPAISQDREIQMRKLRETVELCLETTDALKDFLCSRERKVLLRRLKERFIVSQLRKRFSFLNPKLILANNSMYCCFILVLTNLLQAADPLPDEHESAYKKMWNYIG